MIRDDQNLTRPWHQIDSDTSKDLAFGLRHIGISRSKYFADRLNRFGAKSERSDRLRTADLINFRCTSEAQSYKKAAVDRFTWTDRRSDCDLGNARHFGQ